MMTFKTAAVLFATNIMVNGATALFLWMLTMTFNDSTTCTWEKETDRQVSCRTSSVCNWYILERLYMCMLRFIALVCIQHHSVDIKKYWTHLWLWDYLSPPPPPDYILITHFIIPNVNGTLSSIHGIHVRHVQERVTKTLITLQRKTVIKIRYE